ncbi:MAG: hypothetical protein R2758_09220 [Bacteroidales bacterium]
MTTEQISKEFSVPDTLSWTGSVKAVMLWWPWATITTTGSGSQLFQLSSKHRVITIYKPLTDKNFDRFLQKIRTRFGLWVTPEPIARDLVKCRSEKILTMSGFIRQTPPPDDNAYWTTLQTQDTALPGSGRWR